MRLHVNRVVLTLLVLPVVLLATLWFALVMQLDREEASALREANTNLTNLARAFAEHTAKTLEGADQAVRFVRSEYEEHGRTLNLAAYLSDKTIINAAYHQIAVIGGDGMMLQSDLSKKPVDLSDREHFRVHRGATRDQIFISKPVLGRVSGKWSIQVTRPVIHPERGFDGVIVVSLSPDHLTKFYRDVKLGRHGVITLVGRDGVIRARATSDGKGDEALGQNVEGSQLYRLAMAGGAGVARNVSRVDGIDRLYAYRMLDDYGLYVLTGMSTEEVLAEPRARRQASFAGAGVFSVIILILSFIVARQLQRREALLVRLTDSQKKANEANELKSRFLASVSHELRTPLNGILGYSELIRDTAGEEDVREFGNYVHISARHLHALVNTILDITRIEAGKMPVHPEPLDLPQILDEVVGINAAHATSRGVELVLTVREGCPDVLTTDRTRLVQILNNLINNALKFTSSGAVTLEAGREGDMATLVVRDTGIGIPEARLSSIFERFQSAATEFTHEGQGAGLGLPLTRELVELLGGRIDIASREGEGTIITVRLPITRTEHGHDEHRAGG